MQAGRNSRLAEKIVRKEQAGAKSLSHFASAARVVT
jgi:hypothetical protein